jgi:hypothetical protein
MQNVPQEKRAQKFEDFANFEPVSVHSNLVSAFEKWKMGNSSVETGVENGVDQGDCAPGRHPPKALRPVRKRNKSTRYRPVSGLGLDDCDLSYGLIVGADVCIDGLTTLRKHCRRSCIIATCGYYFRKGQVPPYAVMLSYCLGIFAW